MNKAGQVGALVAWLAAAVIGFIPLFLYAARPGVAHEPAARSAPGDGRMKLVVVLHPRCACSHATLRELERLIARAGDRLEVRALFTGPDGGDTSLRAQARAISGVAIDEDPSGEHARSLGAVTSGEALLYASDGRLLFHGGLTDRRGHETPSAARDSVLALLDGRAPLARTTPVFGCGLRSQP